MAVGRGRVVGISVGIAVIIEPDELEVFFGTFVVAADVEESVGKVIVSNVVVG